ncbi:hypothetical protein KAU18_03570 [Candidatus Bathyarchaeota archaeon]|nr:hypothetical protein [Candidatus Bathyarchaeota archaeon]
MQFLVHVKTENLRRLLASWWNPSKSHRKLREGQMIAKLSGRTYIMDDRGETLALLTDLKGRHPETVLIYEIKEKSIDELQALISDPPVSTSS